MVLLLLRYCTVLHSTGTGTDSAVLYHTPPRPYCISNLLLDFSTVLVLGIVQVQVRVQCAVRTCTAVQLHAIRRDTPVAGYSTAVL